MLPSQSRIFGLGCSRCHVMISSLLAGERVSLFQTVPKLFQNRDIELFWNSLEQGDGTVLEQFGTEYGTEYGTVLKQLGTRKI